MGPASRRDRQVVFSGIVEELGKLRSSAASLGAVRLEFEATIVLIGTNIGDSIAVNGCCLTVVDQGDGWWSAEAVPETLKLTNLSSLRSGDAVNLERAMALSDRLGGHLVQGHIDGVGTVVEPAPNCVIRVPAHIGRYLVTKGSIAVDGCSLTIVEALGESFSVSIIPHTEKATTFGSRRPGDLVNIEVDIIAKYVQAMLPPYLDSKACEAG